ncbi:MAG TPA: phospholipid carrier-dependent glycosyltransferase [bacterium]|jgi:dolichyl-phosphate-mannose-protein mannosyltransferase|nr:phospholipid carrier-dependent glycosyltransferase [bacterium]
MARFKINETRIVLFVLVLIAAAIRIWRMWEPDSFVFDEAYYADYANSLVTGKDWTDVHPPLAEGLISLMIRAFGNFAWVWRLLPVFFGIANVPLICLFARNITKNPKIGLIAAFLVTFDGLFLVHSRAALLVSFVTFFVLCAYTAGSYFVRNFKMRWLVLATLFMGMAISTQWTAIPLWAILALWLITASPIKKHRIEALIMLLLPLLVYMLVLLINCKASYWSWILHWHNYALSFHLKLKGDHAFASRWYDWLYLRQPITYYQSKLAENYYASIVLLGNPVIWWSSIVAFGYSIYAMLYGRNKKYLFLPFITFSVFYFGWSVIGREQFLFYVLPVAPFLFVLLSNLLFDLYKKKATVFFGWIVLALAVFFFFYPLWVGRPISEKYFRATQWLPDWKKINIIDKENPSTS